MLEFLNVPRTRHVEGEVAPPELGPDVGYRAVAQGRRPALAKHVRIEAKRATKARAGKSSPPTVVAQHGFALLEGKGEQWFKLVQRQQDRIGARYFLHCGQGTLPLVPRARWRREARFSEQVAAIKENSRVDVPGDATQSALDD